MTLKTEVQKSERQKYSRDLFLRRHFPFFYPANSPLIIFSSFRSGSNYLLGSLASMPEISGIGYDGEVFKTGAYATYYSIKKENADFQSCVRFVDATCRMHKTRYTAIKIPFEHVKNLKLKYDDLRKAFPDSRWLILYRGNLLEQYISRQKSKTNNFFRWYKGRNRNQDLKLNLNIDDFRLYVREVKSDYRTIVSYVNGEKKIQDLVRLVRYEDILEENIRSWMDEYCRNDLRIEPVEPEVPYRKQQTGSVLDAIENYASVKNQLEEIDYMQEYQFDAG